jgi:hypothetical protein
MASSKNNRAFIKYDGSGNLVSMVLLVRSKMPDGPGWVEVPYNKCCGTLPVSTVHSGINDMKGFIKYDKRGIVVSSSTIKRRKHPRDKQDWVEVPYNYCCQFIPTTTTSSTTTTTTTVATTTTSSTTTTTTTV